ncbi:DCC1-like thiol-disulfide oxidoreductase family protein [Prochlorococcus sp. MIT 0916]|uniref:DCC1-like thiol-disulfide oxidoreductase family protein n=1 Tax=Prochlorococcus sp. MIT 0916 TaxID=3082521 RepID=UPI0039B6C7C9
MQSRNHKGYLSFIDINCSDFSLDIKYGITYKQAMDRIHALKSDASVIKDIKVIQEAYSLIGLGWIYAQQNCPYQIKLLSLFMDYGLNID